MHRTSACRRQGGQVCAARNTFQGECFMKAMTLALGLLTAGFLASADRRAAADDTNGSEWVQLFNGKDLTGWKLHPEPNKGSIVEVTKKEDDGKVVAIFGKLK